MVTQQRLLIEHRFNRPRFKIGRCSRRNSGHYADQFFVAKRRNYPRSAFNPRALRHRIRKGAVQRHRQRDFAVNGHGRQDSV